MEIITVKCKHYKIKIMLDIFKRIAARQRLKKYIYTYFYTIGKYYFRNFAEQKVCLFQPILIK